MHLASTFNEAEPELLAILPPPPKLTFLTLFFIAPPLIMGIRPPPVQIGSIHFERRISAILTFIPKHLSGVAEVLSAGPGDAKWRGAGNPLPPEGTNSSNLK